jgi:lipid-binding SYLF domain-containing protein
MFTTEDHMKSLATCLTCALTVAATTAAFAAIGTDELKRLHDSTEIVRSMHELKAEELPTDVWHEAQCIVVIPDLKKVGFLVGGEFGRGVASCRDASGWSAPAFFKLQRGTWGWQIGAEEIDLVLLVMNRQGLDRLLEDKVTLGASASAAAGPAGRSATAATDISMKGGILSYSRSHGLFAGVDVSGGILAPDQDANEEVYGRALTARDILLERRVPSPPEATTFLEALRAQFGLGSTLQ